MTWRGADRDTEVGRDGLDRTGAINREVLDSNLRAKADPDLEATQLESGRTRLPRATLHPLNMTTTLL